MTGPFAWRMRVADLNDPVPGTGVSYYSTIAALVGSMLTLRFLVEASPRGRAVSVATAFCFTYFIGPSIAEYWQMSAKLERAMFLLLALISTNLLAGAWTFSDKFRQDPQSAVSWLLSILPWPRKA